MASASGAPHSPRSGPHQSSSQPAVTKLKVSFAVELWDGFNVVVQKSKDGVKSLDKVIKFMNEKASLDQYYSKTLKKLAQSALGEVEGTTFQSSLTQFEGLNTILAENHEIFAAKIGEQVKRPLELLRETLVKASKTLYQNGAAWTKQMQTAQAKLDKAKLTCEAVCKQSASARRAYKLAAASQRERAELLTDPNQLAQYAQNTAKAKRKAEDLSKEAIAADRQFMAEVKNVRDLRVKYDAAMANILSQFEHVEANRLNGIAAVLKHYMTVQQAMMDSMKKTVGVVAGMMNRMDPMADLNEFIVSKMSGQSPAPLPEYETFEGHPTYAPSDALATFESADSKDAQRDHSGSGAGDADVPPGSGDAEALDDGDDQGDEITLFDASAVKAAAQSTPTAASSSSAAKKTGGAAVEHRDSDSSRSADSTGSGSAGSFVMVPGHAELHVPAQPPKRPGSAPKSTATPTDERDKTDANAAEMERKMQDLMRHFLRAAGKSGAQRASDDSADHDHDFEHLTPRGTSSVKAADEQKLLADPTPLLPQLHALLKTPAGREAFAAALNQQRSTNAGLNLEKESFEHLATIVNLFLDEASAKMHVRPAMLVMIMSQTLYYLPTTPEELKLDQANIITSRPDEPGRVYLQARIKRHAIWKSMRFWEEAFFDALTAAVSKQMKMQKWHSDLEQADSLARQKNVLFAQLGTFAHNMTDFGMDHEAARAFVEKMCRINELETEQMQVLLQMPCLQPAAKPSSPTLTGAAGAGSASDRFASDELP